MDSLYVMMNVSTWCTWLAMFPDFPLSPGIHFNPVLSVPSTCMDQLLHRYKV